MIILHQNFEMLCKFNTKLLFVNLFLNQNTNFVKASDPSALFVTTEVLNELSRQGHAKWVKVGLRKGPLMVRAEQRDG